MTIVEFPDGRIVEFPTGTPEPVIKQMVADFIFPPPAPAPSLPAADDVMPEAEVFLEPDVLEPEEPAALLEPAPPEQALAPPAVLPLVARFRLTPYTDDENLLGTVPAMSPRERAERLQAEMINARIGQPDESNPFRDNWRPHWVWAALKHSHIKVGWSYIGTDRAGAEDRSRNNARLLPAIGMANAEPSVYATVPMKRKHVPVRNNSKGNMFTPRAATPSQVPVRRFARGDD